MGILSELALDNTYRGERSYTSQLVQLKWRIGDLREKLDSVAWDSYGMPFCEEEGTAFSEEDLAYALVDCFTRPSDIVKALRIAEEKLALLKGMPEYEDDEESETVPELAEEIPGQISVLDLDPPAFGMTAAELELVPAA